MYFAQSNFMQSTVTFDRECRGRAARSRVGSEAQNGGGTVQIGGGETAKFNRILSRNALFMRVSRFSVFNLCSARRRWRVQFSPPRAGGFQARPATLRAEMVTSAHVDFEGGGVAEKGRRSRRRAYIYNPHPPTTTKGAAEKQGAHVSRKWGVLFFRNAKGGKAHNFHDLELCEARKMRTNIRQNP